MHRGAFHQFSFRWILYYGSNKSTGLETDKSHLCAVAKVALGFGCAKQSKNLEWYLISITLKCILSTFIEDAEVGTYDGVSMDSACNTAHKTASAYISEIKPKI